MNMGNVADWLQALSIMVTAIFAVHSLHAWRTQMIGQRKFSVAEDALMTFSMCKLVLEEARSPMSYPGEGEALMDESGVPKEDRDHLNQYFAVLNRLNLGKEHFSKLISVQLESKIHLGPKAYSAIGVIWKMRSKVRTAAQMLILNHRDKHNPNKDRDHINRMQENIWGG